MDPRQLREWIRVVRDLVIVVLATFMLTYEVTFKEHPNAVVIGAGLSLLGLPPIFRLDEWLRREENE